MPQKSGNLNRFESLWHLPTFNRSPAFREEPEFLVDAGPARRSPDARFRGFPASLASPKPAPRLLNLRQNGASNTMRSIL